MSASKRRSRKKATERRKKQKEKLKTFLDKTIEYECPNCNLLTAHKKVPFAYNYYCWECSNCKACWYSSYI